MVIYCLQHVWFEIPGLIADWCHTHNHELRIIQLWNGQLLPSPDEAERLLLLGAPMSVNDYVKVDFIRAEIDFLRDYMKAGKPVLGICFGAQLMAHALGESVYPAREKEIGWFEVHATEAGKYFFPHTFTPFHWHGETFDLPAHTILLASTTGCRNQAFLAGPKQLGLQFHLEANQLLIENMLVHCNDELQPLPGIQSPAEIKSQATAHIAMNKPILERLLNYVFE
jgi:GMP synthase-like glutamine amidotransferase